MEEIKTIEFKEFEKNLKLYLIDATKEDCIVTLNGKPFIRLSSALDPDISFWEKYRGIIKEEDLDLEDPKILGILKKLWD